LLTAALLLMWCNAPSAGWAWSPPVLSFIEENNWQKNNWLIYGFEIAVIF
jgi:hypothetical protein